MNNYQLKGFVLKQVIQDIKDALAGVLEGPAADVVADNHVIIYKIDRTKGIMGVPFLKWKAGTLSKRASTRGMNLEYIVPLNRSKGLLVTRTDWILVPLMN